MNSVSNNPIGLLKRSKRMAAVIALALCSSSAMLLSGCASVEPAVYKAEKPVLILEEYFNGTVDAWGFFQDRSGKIVKRFTVVMRCNWQGDTGTLDEDFSYSDGTKDKRIWTIKKMGNGRYVGTAADVVGSAEGTASGNTLFWSYTLALPVDGKVYNVQLEDWLYQMDDKVMLNKAVMSKFGVRLGEITLSFRKR
jgi:Protein of unknown function (DUF3833)